jgi:hypothetical protein
VWITDRPIQTDPFGLSVWVRRGSRSVGLGLSGFSSPVCLGLTVRSRCSTVLPKVTHYVMPGQPESSALPKHEDSLLHY